MANNDIVKPLSAGQVVLNGRLGRQLKRSIENRLKKVNYAHLVDPFRNRDERDGRWRCEFWGKIVRSAILSWRDTNDAELLRLIKATVADLLSTQTDDGCISSYPYELQTQDWDLWGRKYVMIGLSRYYLEVEPSKEVRTALARELDYLMTQVGPGKKNIVDCGHQAGLAASSLLEPVVLVYRITGEKRFLDYAEWIVGQGGSNVNNIFTSAREGAPPRLLGNGKAYEMMSCFEGLAELYRETGNPAYLESVLALYRAVRDQEIFITGVGGLKDRWGEFWYDGILKQTQFDVGALGETCVTTTWIKLCSQVLRLTGDATVVDEMERALYNGILGAMVPDGSWWMHCNPTPLAGPAEKIRAGDQIPGYGEDCCLAQGPKALAVAPWLAIMQDVDGPVVNLYEKGQAKLSVNNIEVGLSISGDYPRSGTVTVAVEPAAETEFTVKLRIPAWSSRTVVEVGDKAYPSEPGTYLSITRHWCSGDCVKIQFELNLRLIPAFDGCNRVAILRGPIVLARDSRLGDVNSPFSDDSQDFILESPVEEQFFDVYRFSDGSRLCDYASAGNEFNPENRLCVWMEKS